MPTFKGSSTIMSLMISLRVTSSYQQDVTTQESMAKYVHSALVRHYKVALASNDDRGIVPLVVMVDQLVAN